MLTLSKPIEEQINAYGLVNAIAVETIASIIISSDIYIARVFRLQIYE